MSHRPNPGVEMITQQNYQLDHDNESGIESVNLDSFFEEVKNVEEDMRQVEKLYRDLQNVYEQSRLVYTAKTLKELRAQMDSDVGQVLNRVKIIEGKLEGLKRYNAAHRNLPGGCGQGSSADRARTSVTSGLVKKLKEIMDDFEEFRGGMTDEYKERIELGYIAITRKTASEETIEELISTGTSEDFLFDEFQKRSWKWTCIPVLALLVGFVFLLFPVAFTWFQTLT